MSQIFENDLQNVLGGGKGFTTKLAAATFLLTSIGSTGFMLQTSASIEGFNQLKLSELNFEAIKENDFSSLVKELEDALKEYKTAKAFLGKKFCEQTDKEAIISNLTILWKTNYLWDKIDTFFEEHEDLESLKAFIKQVEKAIDFSSFEKINAYNESEEMENLKIDYTILNFTVSL